MPWFMEGKTADLIPDHRILTSKPLEAALMSVSTPRLNLSEAVSVVKVEVIVISQFIFIGRNTTPGTIVLKEMQRRHIEG